MPLSFDLEALWTWLFATVELGATIVMTWHFLTLVKISDRRGEADRAEAALRARKDVKGVDILIPTYNEPEEILRRTITAASQVDYPDYQVWVLDDGNRTWLRDLCEKSGVSSSTHTW